jgi:hypothetical protein
VSPRWWKLVPVILIGLGLYVAAVLLGNLMGLTQ